MKKIEELESRIRKLEEKGFAGRRPLKLEEAKQHLRDTLSDGKLHAVNKIVQKSPYGHSLLSKARRALGYKVTAQGGNWYWSVK